MALVRRIVRSGKLHFSSSSITPGGLAHSPFAPPRKTRGRPIPDPYGGNITVVAKHADGTCVEEKVLPGVRRQTEPARAKHTQHMPVRK
jgi:hypothetical protein